MATNLCKDKKTTSHQSEQPSDDDDDEVGPKIKLPHKLFEILKEADKQLDDQWSAQRMYDQLYSGIYLKQKKQKFWVDKNLKNYFMLYAKDLQIIWGEDRRYWHWPMLKDQESSEVSTFEAAELLNVCWLEINGNFQIFKLSPGTRYEVVFILMIKNPAYGWDIPVNLRLTLPDKSIQHHKENLMQKQTGSWIEIPVGDFMTSSHQNMKSSCTNPAGDMEISMYGTEGLRWKKGLVIKGVCIRPKISP